MGRRYIPALGYDWLTTLYDPLVRRTINESGFQRRLVGQSGILSQHRVLDLGCGTATLALLICQMHPQMLVVGLDGDPRALNIAKGKSQRIGVDFDMHCAMAFQLPYADGSFDRVLSSLLFHHLGSEGKRKILSEVWRVLRPGGELHFADREKAEDWQMRTAFLLVQFLDGFKSTSENVRGALPKLLNQAGFVNVHETERLRTIFGNLALVQARKAPANFWLPLLLGDEPNWGHLLRLTIVSKFSCRSPRLALTRGRLRRPSYENSSGICSSAKTPARILGILNSKDEKRLLYSRTRAKQASLL